MDAQINGTETLAIRCHKRPTQCKNLDTENKDVTAQAVKACYVPEVHILMISGIITYCFYDFLGYQ